MKNLDKVAYPSPKQEYMVLVRCFTYNHSQYVKSALNGFAMQQTNFPFVCLVMDDASDDGEQDIIREWMAGECDMSRAETIDIPTSIVVIVPHKTNSSCTFAFYLLKQNLYGTGFLKMKHVYPWRDKCKYEALCEGDDYWIDPLKLQKQVDLLERYPNISMACGAYMNNHVKKVCPNQNVILENSVVTFSLEDWSNKWLTKTLTVVIRCDFLKNISSQLLTYKHMRDIHLFYHLLRVGDGIYLPDILGVYNIHEGGVCSLVSMEENAEHSYNCYKELYINNCTEPVIRKLFFCSILRLLMLQSYSRKRVELLIEGIQLDITLKQKIKLVIAIIMPKQISKIYINSK